MGSMQTIIKTLARIFFSKSIRDLFGPYYPKIYKVNTYIRAGLNNPLPLPPIGAQYKIREVNEKDIPALRAAHEARGNRSYQLKVPPRLAAPEWTGLAVFDKNNDKIAYIAWVVIKHIPYIGEFGIKLGPGQFLVKDGYCVPEYRHQGLHTRMEIERLNYCIRQGAREVFIQIHDANKKGVESVKGNGYKFVRQDLVLAIGGMNIYRPLKAFLKNPLKKIVK